MLELRTTATFNRDLKRMKRRGKDLARLAAVLDSLAAGNPLPERCREHRLSDNWRGFWDCHVEPDWLLLYERTPDAIILARTGTHGDLFR
jgi:mRNA interferase YafQ